MCHEYIRTYVLQGKVDTTDLTWWAVTLSHLGDVLGHLNTLSSLPDLDFNNLQADLLIYMQKFLFDNGPEVIAKRYLKAFIS